MKKIELTADWIFTEFISDHYLGDDGEICIETGEDDYKWVKLAADSLEIEYELSEYGNVSEERLTYVFVFKQDELNQYCPTICKITKN